MEERVVLRLEVASFGFIVRVHSSRIRALLLLP
jgi:hypothetical protein